MQGPLNSVTHIDFNVAPLTSCFKNARLVVLPSWKQLRLWRRGRRLIADHNSVVNSDDNLLGIIQNLTYLNQVTAAVCEVPLCDFVQWCTQESPLQHMLHVS